MKNKGFTLIELLMTLVILGIVATITIHVGIDTVNKSKEKERELLKENIKAAVDNLKLDCNYMEDDSIASACDHLNSGYIYISDLIDYGYLSTNDRNEDNNLLDIKDPVSRDWIRSCKFSYDNGVYTVIEGTDFCDSLEE